MSSTIVVCSEPLAERSIEGDLDMARLSATPFDKVSGDVFNIAGDLARLHPVVARHYGRPDAGLKVGLLAAVGDDASNPRGNHAEKIREFAEGDGIDTSLLFTIPGKLTGAYTINPLPSGEKKVFYHDRHDAAMRDLFAPGAVPALDEKLRQMVQNLTPASPEDKNYFIVTGIAASRPRTQEDFERLLDTVSRAKAAGATIVFDTNNRLRLWQDEHDSVRDEEWSRPGYKAGNDHTDKVAHAMAEQRMDKLFELSDIVFVTHPDDTRSHRWPSARGAGSELMKAFPQIQTVVVKEGEKGAMAFNRNGKEVELIQQPAIPIPADRRAVDSSGAGDSMAAGFVLAQSHGASVREALAVGALAGSLAVQYPGGVFPKDGDALERFGAGIPAVAEQARRQAELVGSGLETPLT